MAYSQGFLDEVRRRLTLSTVIGRTVKLIKSGREYKACCPFHQEKTPSFTVNDDKGFYHCFGCGAHGDVITYVMETDNLGFPEAVERLAGEAGLEVPHATPEETARAKRQASVLEVIEAACCFFEQQMRMPGGQRGLDYLKQRGVDDETISRFRLGWAPPAGALKGALARQNISDEQLVEAGLLKRFDDGSLYDYFRRRVMFPITDHRGRVIAFGGRMLGDGQPKYLNSPETPVFQKGTVLYGLAHARKAAKHSGRIIVAEGYMDVIALSKAGFEDAVAPLGTALSETQIEELWRLADEPIVCFDADAAGGRAAARVADCSLPLLKPGKSLRFAVMNGAKDPDALIREQGRDAMQAVLRGARPLLDMMWGQLTQNRDLATPERRAALERDVSETCGRIIDRSVRDHYRRALKDRLWGLFHPHRRSGRPFGKPMTGRPTGRRVKGTGQPDRPSLGHVGIGVGLGSGKNKALHHRILLVTVITHPDLADDVAERLGALDYDDAEMDRLRRAVLEILAQEPALDSASLMNHLRSKGMGSGLDALMRSNVFTHAAFARPGTQEQEARAGWDHTYALMRQKNLMADINQVVDRLSDSPSHHDFEALVALKSSQRVSEDD